MAKSAIGSLYVSLTANTTKFRKSFRKAARRVHQFRKDFNTQATRVAKVGGAMFAGAAVGVSYYVKRSMDAIDATAKLADRVGGTVDGMRGLQHAANLTGTSAATMNKSLEKMRKNLGDASMGTGEAKRYLDAMGLSARDLAGMNAEDAFAAIADGIGGLANESEKAAAAQALFGRSGVQMLNMLNQGGASIRKMTADAIKLRGSLSRVDAKGIEQANDALSDMGVAAEGAWDKLAVALSPAVTAFAQQATAAFVALRKGVSRELAGIADALLKLDANGSLAAFVNRVRTGMKAVASVFHFTAASLQYFGGMVARVIGGAMDVIGRFRDALRQLQYASKFQDISDRLEAVQSGKANGDVAKIMRERDALFAQMQALRKRDQARFQDKGELAKWGKSQMEGAAKNWSDTWEDLMKTAGRTGGRVLGEETRKALKKVATGIDPSAVVGSMMDNIQKGLAAQQKALAASAPKTGQAILPAQAKFAGAALMGSQEAYRASLPSDVAGKGAEKAQRDTAANTKATVTKLDGVIAAINRSMGDTGLAVAPI